MIVLRRLRVSRREDERGSVLPLVTLALVALMTCAALAIDIGSVASTNRRLQGVADLAAIAGSEQLIGAACGYSYKLASDTDPAGSTVFNHVRAAAVANATSNSFVPVGAKTLVVDVGTIAYSGGTPTFTTMWSTANGGDCTSASVPTAVRVTAGDFTTYGFGNIAGQKGRTTTRSGTAGQKSDGSDTRGGFTIGSLLASLDTNSSPILSSVLQGMICGSTVGCSFTTTLVGYQGLATAGLTLGQLTLAANAGSVSTLLDTSLRARDFYIYSAKALGCTAVAGCSNAAAVTLLGLSTTVTSTATFKLKNLITVATGSETAAAATTFNVFSLVTGSAELINGTNAVSIPVTTVTIPGTSATTLSVKVIEAPQTYIGPVGGSVSTSQVDITVSESLNLLGLLSNPLASVTGTLPVKVTAASAKGTLTQVNCTAPRGEVVSVDTTGATTKVGTAATPGNLLDVNLSLPLLGDVKVATLALSAASSVAGVNGNQLSFSYPNGYLPAAAAPTHVGGTTLNVQGTSVTSSLTMLSGLLTVDASALTTALVGPTGLLTTLDTLVISPILRALGVDVGGADVWAIGSPGCGTPVIRA